MTEAEWLACSDPKQMTEAYRGDERKLRLWGCGCCDLIRHLFPSGCYREAVAAAERFADGAITRAELDRHGRAVWDGYRAVWQSWPLSVEAVQGRVLEAVAAVCSAERRHLEYALWFNVALALEGERLGQLHGENAGDILPGWLEATSEYHHDFEWFLRWADIDPRPRIASLLRDVVGNPFRPVAFDPAWRTDTAAALARGIYEERAFDRLPILADALQDAGCDNEDVLAHCRDANATHVRGCWVVDLVLGKE